MSFEQAEMNRFNRIKEQAEAAKPSSTPPTEREQPPAPSAKSTPPTEREQPPAKKDEEEKPKEQPAGSGPPIQATTTTTPRELIRENSDPIVLATTPDVAFTPIGSSSVPIPYWTYAQFVLISNFANTVYATRNPIMVLHSRAVMTRGAEPGTDLGIVSGTINDEVEPLEHSTNVRVEGSEIVRHGDLMWMNMRNNFGIAQYLMSYANKTYSFGADDNEEEKEKEREEEKEEEEEEDDGGGYWGKGIVDSATNWVKDKNEDYKLTERGVGAMQLFGGTASMAAGGVLLGFGGAASATGVGAPLGGLSLIGGGALVAFGSDEAWAGAQSLSSGEIHDSYLEKTVAWGVEELGGSEDAQMYAQSIAGMAIGGGLDDFAKQGIKRGAKEAAEEAAEKTAKESVEATGRVTGNYTQAQLKAAQNTGYHPSYFDETGELIDEFANVNIHGKPQKTNGPNGQNHADAGALDGMDMVNRGASELFFHKSLKTTMRELGLNPVDDSVINWKPDSVGFFPNGGTNGGPAIQIVENASPSQSISSQMAKATQMGDEIQAANPGIEVLDPIVNK